MVNKNDTSKSTTIKDKVSETELLKMHEAYELRFKLEKEKEKIKKLKLKLIK